MRVKIRLDRADDNLDEHPQRGSLMFEDVTLEQGVKIMRILTPDRLVTTMRAYLDETHRRGVA